MADLEIENGILKKYSASGSNAVIPQGVTGIGFCAFMGREDVERVDIPNGVKSIGRRAFLGCKRLCELRLPDGLTDIGMESFGGCESLMRINIPGSVEVIEESAFSFCSALREVRISTRQLCLLEKNEEAYAAGVRSCVSLAEAGELSEDELSELATSFYDNIDKLRRELSEEAVFVRFALQRGIISVRLRYALLEICKNAECRALLLDNVRGNTVNIDEEFGLDG